MTTLQLPIEIVLDSPLGITQNNIDGHKIFKLNNSILARRDEKILFYLKKAFIPFSFYCISDSQNNNKLDITETQSDNTTNTYSITISQGNPDIYNLLLEIKNLLESNSTFNFKYDITYNASNNKISIKLLSGDSATKSTLLFNSGTNKTKSINNVLGFLNNSDKDILVNNTISSDNQVDLADGLDSIHIKSNLCGTNIRSIDDESNELLIIPIDKSPYSIIYFDDPKPFKHLLSINVITDIEIILQDSNKNVINMNNIPYTLILECEFIKDIREDIVEVAEEFNYANNLEKFNNLKNKILF
tara:strand:- start:1125 stop:2030 length:906 start_codon:yes stop_codon:yes gene_type:complete